MTKTEYRRIASEVVASYPGVSIADIESSSCRRDIVEARCMVTMIAHNKGASMAEIAYYMNQALSTISHNMRTITLELAKGGIIYCHYLSLLSRIDYQA